ncbi:MAG: single-stranded DNA-binding protein [Spirochaetales bacterium]|nr:single-stranded DNA-binding protein [Spirochaetales bacterium]
MTNSLNLSIIEGRVTRTPDLLYTKNGNAMCKFDLAVNEYYKTDNDYKTITSFITINLWGKYAESITQYLEQGTPVRVQGSIRQNSWEDKDGNKHSDLYINASAVDFLDWNKSTQQEKINA